MGAVRTPVMCVNSGFSSNSGFETIGAWIILRIDSVEVKNGTPIAFEILDLYPLQQIGTPAVHAPVGRSGEEREAYLAEICINHASAKRPLRMTNQNLHFQRIR